MLIFWKKPSYPVENVCIGLDTTTLPHAEVRNRTWVAAVAREYFPPFQICIIPYVWNLQWLLVPTPVKKQMLFIKWDQQAFKHARRVKTCFYSNIKSSITDEWYWGQFCYSI